MSRQPVLNRQTFNFNSYPAAPLKITGGQAELQVNLEYPEASNPRTVRWAKGLYQQSGDNTVFANRLMQYFATENFSYTLTPPVMPAAPVDAFLFEARQGFCAHYASAMALAFRAAGIPARLVSGYQGGDLISAKVMNVYQYDAHAWVEASLDGKTWQQFDPTTMVAASRLLYGFQSAFSNQQQDLPLFSRNRAHNVPALAQLYQFADTINYQWNRWVLGFDGATQQDMFTRLLGNTSMERMTLFMLAVVLFIAGLLAFYFVPRPAPRIKSESLRLYQDAQQEIYKVTGIARHNTSARTYARHVSGHINAAACTALDNFVKVFEAIEYQPGDHTKQRQLLRQHFKQLKKSLRHHPAK
ncbi:transglutaminase-like domain-containing protein [Salinimonas marina]|nr:transglutaminase-like domain-containing protein [Salinimonas marina]